MTSTIKVNNIQNQCGANIINENSNTITIGASGDTISLASGASQTGFGREGSVNWQTSSIKTTTFTAVSGEGYFVDTSSGAVTANLPAGSAGAIVAFSDYARTFANNNLTISPNGSNNIGGSGGDVGLDISGQSATFVYVDGTKGWINVQNAEDTEVGATFISATGGTITTVCTNFKVHTFTGPGTFCVSAGSGPLAKVSYAIIAGGGGGGGDYGGGGGGGGFREARTPDCSYAVSPLAKTCETTLLSTGAYPIVVGAGGTASAAPNPPQGGDGGDSSFNSITSAGGGGGGTEEGGQRGGRSGGSGGGASYINPCGTTFGNGNTPPVTPPQGNNGGQGSPGPYLVGGGGGGATVVGTTPGSNTQAGPGGAGATTSITGSPVARSGGGGGAGGGSPFGQGYTPGTGGTGGGGAGAPDSNAAGIAGTVNTGGGGGGANNVNYNSGAGGSGIVIIRYKFQ
jgi:hypothetical protein